MGGAQVGVVVLSGVVRSFGVWGAVDMVVVSVVVSLLQRVPIFGSCGLVGVDLLGWVLVDGGGGGGGVGDDKYHRPNAVTRVASTIDSFGG